MNMHKGIVRGLLLVGYCVPFAFLSMYGDVTYDTMLLYGFLTAGFSGLCFGVIKSKQLIVAILGNALSFIASYICVQQFHTDEWGWYFKPFTASGLLVVISAIAALVQLLFVYKSYRKQQTK
jgi:hypothetical protein